MPPRVGSRYAFCEGVKDEYGKYFLTDRPVFKWDSKLAGTREHVIGKEDTLAGIAARYFYGIKNAEHLWWVILDFQPVENAILDPTLPLEEGKKLKIPSFRVVRERILGG